MSSSTRSVQRVLRAGLRRLALLTVPALYGSGQVAFETGLHDALDELLGQLDQALAVPGEIVECGSYTCGSSVIIARHLRQRGQARTVYAYDSFAGFALSELAHERASGLTEELDSSFTGTSYHYVRLKLRRLGLAGAVVPVRGYFEQTLPAATGPVCFALIDCDLRDSVRYCAEQIWPRLSPGGRMVFDDYRSHNFRGARLGIEDFLGQHRDEIADHGLIRRLYYVYKAPSGRNSNGSAGN